MKKRSVGLLERWGHIPVVEAVDAGVEQPMYFWGYEITKVALVTVNLSGDVAAVRAAVTAGAQAVRKVGKAVEGQTILTLQSLQRSVE